jgi:hypothetical protein
MNHVCLGTKSLAGIDVVLKLFFMNECHAAVSITMDKCREKMFYLGDFTYRWDGMKWENLLKDFGNYRRRDFFFLSRW